MQIFKRLLAVFLMCAMVLSLVACGAPVAQDQIGLQNGDFVNNGTKQENTEPATGLEDDQADVSDPPAEEEETTSPSEDTAQKETESAATNPPGGNQSQQTGSDVSDDAAHDEEVSAGQENAEEPSDEELSGGQENAGEPSDEEVSDGQENAGEPSDEEAKGDHDDQTADLTDKKPESSTENPPVIDLSNGNQSQQVESNVTDAMDRDDKELVVELLGGKENTSDLTDDELDDVVDQIVDEIGKDVVSGEDEPQTEPEVDITLNPDAYDEEGAMKEPFDQVYPELIEKELVAFSGESILLKLADGTLTDGLVAAGIGALEVIVPMSGYAWYEAKLVEGTDAKTALAAVRELDEVLLAEYNYEVQTAALDDYKHFDKDKDEDFKKNGHNKDQWHFHHCGIVDGYEEMVTAGGDSSVIVAVIDSGVDYDHEDLIDNMWVNTKETPDNGIDDDRNGYVDDYYGVDIVSGRGNGDDTNGHGTHVAGIIAARNNNVGVLGIAYNVKIMSVKAAMHNGTLNQADIAKAILYAYENGAEVINMSFGGTACSLAVQDALATAYTRCVLVASAGNSGAPNESIGMWIPMPNYPAALTYVLGVMSVDETGRESAFTNWDVGAFNGVEYELYAPGENIMSTLPGNKYGYLSGTSMAAPVVSAFAAILRSEFTDRDKYPTKFIYGQLAATSGIYADCLDPESHGAHNLPQVVDLNAALTVLPKPEVNMQDYRVFDDPKYSDKNNGDGVIDAGETFALGLTLRNRWGMSENTMVSIDTISANSGMSDPYITIQNPTVNYGSVGTYSTQDCGKVMSDDGVLFIGWENPFLITVSEDCPNDYRFTINVTVTCENALDEADETVYRTGGSVNENVRAGYIVPSIIEEDMVWTKDNLYIIPHATLIQPGVTVRVEPGTHIQFWSDDPNDSYAENYMAYLRVDGTLLVEGTKEEPVYIYPSQLMDRYNVELTEGGDTGYISLKYADVTNLAINYNGNSGYRNIISLAEHCTFRINYGDYMYYRYLSGSSVNSSYTDSYAIATFGLVRNSVFYKIGSSYDTPAFLGNAENCIFAHCGLEYGGDDGESFTAVNCVFLGNVFVDQTKPDYYTNSQWIVHDNGSLNNMDQSYFRVFYRAETGTTYVLGSYKLGVAGILKLYKDADYAVCETEEEFNWITNNVRTYSSNSSYYFGMEYDEECGEYTWADGSAIQDFLDPNQSRKNYMGQYIPIVKYDYDAEKWSMVSSYNLSYYVPYAVIEIPGQVLPETITFADYEVLMDMESTYQIAPISAPIPLPADGFLYESTDENVLTVSESGLITPVALGTADVKVYSLDRAVYNYITVNVVEYVPLEGIAFEQESGEVAIGEVLKTTVILTPADTSRRGVRYSSSDPAVATVDLYSGVVTGVSSGTATITATCEEFSAQMTVTVYKRAATMSVNNYLYENLSDGTVALPQVTADGETDLVWESTDTTVAQVSDGMLELKKAGTTNLIVTDSRSGLRDTAILYVFENGLSAVKSISSSYAHTCILLEDGRVFLQATNIDGYKKPVLVMEDVRNCSSGISSYGAVYIVAVKNDGTLVRWDTGGDEIGKDFPDLDFVDVYMQISPSFEACAWTADGELYRFNYNLEASKLDVGIKVAKVAGGLYHLVALLSQDGSLYKALDESLSNLQLVAKNVTELDDALASWYVSGGKLYYYGIETALHGVTEVSYDDGSPIVVQAYSNNQAFSLGFSDGVLTLYEHRPSSYNGMPVLRHNEYPIEMEEPVKQIFYDGRPYVVTESDAIYQVNLVADIWNNVEGIKNLEAIMLEQFEGDFIQVSDTNLAEVNQGDSVVRVLSDDVLELTFNKIPVGTEGITLYEDGFTVGSVSVLTDNKLVVESNFGFDPGHTYQLTISAESFRAETGALLNGDYTISFVCEESEQEETQPDNEEQEKAPVIHESVLDESIQRIYTAESLYAELLEIHEQRQINPNFYGNVILNHVTTDDNVNHWFRPQAPNSTSYQEMPLGGNYWGTINEKAIELQMVDYTDYPTYKRLMYAPYLMEAPENTFPFITSVKLFNKYGEEVTVVGNEEITFQIKFNRDMDTEIPLLVRFGSAYPYGDYEFEGQYVDARTWEGTYTLNTLIENGYQYFTISEGCSATDDLPLMIDRYRFGFEIDTTAAQALIMQGTATESGIELRWTQDDFKTLMGYNVYRSDKEDGLYTRLNDVVIPADTMTFFDDTVEPGKIYYYNFTVVQTDLNESVPSGKIVIMSKDTMAPNIYHSPAVNAVTGSNLVLSATITDNLNIAYANLYYRMAGTDSWNTIRMNKLNDKYSAIVPAQYITLAGVEYYIEAFDGVSYTYKGSEEDPYVIAVQEAVGADALGDVDGDGMITNLDALLVLYTINDKYNMTTEEFARADLNGDGELWAAEALRILQYVSGVVGSVKM